MFGSSCRILPLKPLLHAFFHDEREPSWPCPLASRFDAINSAVTHWLHEDYLQNAKPSEFIRTITAFYECVVDPPLHGDTVRRQSDLIRHALNHFFHSRESIPSKVDRLLTASGVYQVPGLGPSFWSAVIQAIDPHRLPGWLPSTVRGLQKLGLIPARFYERCGAAYGSLTAAYDRLRAGCPELTAQKIDAFLARVSATTSRELATLTRNSDPFAAALHRQRDQFPLPQRVSRQSKLFEAARTQLEKGLHDGNADLIREALTEADPSLSKRLAMLPSYEHDALAIWIGRLWEADKPFEMLSTYIAADALPLCGFSLAIAALSLRDPLRFPPWNEEIRRGFSILDDAADRGEALSERYQLFVEGAAWLTRHHECHPFELPSVLSDLVDTAGSPVADRSFLGFCSDSFQFLRELQVNNCREWMTAERERYQYAVREPLHELCETLAKRYIAPVAGGVHGWSLVTEPRKGRSLSSVCKNDFGRSDPYQTVLWITYYRTDRGRKRDDAQLFVKLEAKGLSFGVYIGPSAIGARRQFQENVTAHANELFRTLDQSGALSQMSFAHQPGQLIAAPLAIQKPEDLVAWAASNELTIGKFIDAAAPILRSDDLVGEIILAFDRLLPTIAFAIESDPSPWLKALPWAATPPAISDQRFRRETYLDAEWLRKARSLLELKRQLILQGVPGTGKTHVARSLATWLTGGCDGTTRLVQFHPGYSYESFVEGIKPRSTEIGGRNEISYPVEDGVLAEFASVAARRPSIPHVLLIDEINRGNLPRVFGELLYLLEYRGESIGLPYSRRGFQLPGNLYLIGTMNAADRSAMLLDHALRRRFSFFELAPDAGVLAAWLRDHPPKAGDAFAQTVVALFEGLNLRLRNDLGSPYQVGHSYFMVPQLDEEKLEMIWNHHVTPLIADYFATRPERAAHYSLDHLLSGDKKRAKALPRN
jgi:hypothetical protein